MVAVYKVCAVTVLFFFYLCEKSAASGIGRCPRLNYMSKFNVTRFNGRWYEIERSFYLMQVISTCVSIDLQPNNRGNIAVDVKTRSTWTGSLTVSEGIASQTKRDPSLLLYKVVSNLPRIVSRYLPGAGFYQVLDTDYDNFALLYSCTNYGLIHTDLIWIWGRQQEIETKIRMHIYELLNKLDLDTDRLILPKNANCTD